jgi:hypothetical protein
MAKETYKCSTCKRIRLYSEFYENPTQQSRPVTYSCRDCLSWKDRDTEYYQQRLRIYGRVCAECNEPRPLIKNVVCKGCLHAKGLKYCTKCKEILLEELNFYKTKCVCIKCYVLINRKTEIRRSKRGRKR